MSNKEKKVLTITLNPSVDISTETDKVIIDEKTRCAQPKHDPGGGGINVARVVSRLGSCSEALFIAGGYTGDKLIAMLEEESIHCHAVRSPQLTRQNIAIIDRSIEKQYRFVLPGCVPDDQIWQDALDIVRDEAEEYDYIVGSGSLPDGVPNDFYSRVAKIASDAGQKFVLDTSGKALMNGVQNGAFFIKPNNEEFKKLKKLYGVTEDKELLEKLFSNGIEHVIQTFGKDKTVLHTPEKSSSFKPPSITPKSAIGAGDSFVGGMITGLINGFPMDKAIRYGISAAASTLQSSGTDLCEKGEVEEIFAVNYGGES